MSKPKGGRGKNAPYKTKHIRVPEPIAPQVDTLIEIYQSYIESGKDASNPPDFLASYKPVNNFSETDIKAVNKFAEIIAVLTEALDLKANAGGAIKSRIRKAIKALEELE
jgi:hypothetical protein